MSYSKLQAWANLPLQRQCPPRGAQRLDTYPTLVVVPEELVIWILGFLENRRDIVNASIVSRQFHQCLWRRLWTCVKFSFTGKTWFKAFVFFKIQSQIGQHVRQLDLGSTYLSHIATSYIKPKVLELVFPNVEHLLVGLPQIDIFQSLRNKIHTLTLRLVRKPLYRQHRSTAAWNLLLAPKLKSLRIEGGRSLPQRHAQYWSRDLLYDLEQRSVKLESLTFRACDTVGSSITRKLPVKNLCYLAFQIHGEPHGCPSCPLTCLEHVLQAPEREKLAVIARADPSLKTEHSTSIRLGLQLWTRIRNHNMKKLTLPEEPTVLSSYDLTDYLPPNLEALQIHCSQPTSSDFDSDRNLIRRAILNRLAQNKSATLPRLSRVIWWYESRNDQGLPECIKNSMKGLDDVFRKIDVKFEICEAAKFADTPLGWKHGI